MSLASNNEIGRREIPCGEQILKSLDKSGERGEIKLRVFPVNEIPLWSQIRGLN